MDSPIIFLDIDGVLNNAKGGYRNIDPDCAAHLDWLLTESDANLVISSTWRGLLHNGHMDCRGFGYMLRTHGICGLKVIGFTRQSKRCDDNGDRDERGRQIQDWRRDNSHCGPFVAIDDDDDISAYGVPLVQTNPSIGLTREDAARALEYLKAAPARAPEGGEASK